MALKSRTDIKSLRFTDSSTTSFPARNLALNIGSDPVEQAARLGQHFLTRNRAILASLDVESSLSYTNSNININFQSSSTVGTVPLISPTTGRPDFSLVIEPRLGWLGLGEMLGTMGWKVLPNIMTNLPLLPRSARDIPRWVMAAIIIPRIEIILNMIQRRFEYTEEDLSHPRGTINWGAYVSHELPRMQLLRVPCRFPELINDRELRAALHYVLRVQLSSLETQRSAGYFVLVLIDRCQKLIRMVNDVSPKAPTPKQLYSWMHVSIRNENFLKGLQAIEWTVEEKGLAGVTDLEGLPWRLSMDQFFEGWVESVVGKLAPRIGARVKVGRKQETVVPISWEKSYLGSQKSLRPDLVLEREDEVIIIDAKYKDHWEDLQAHRWTSLEDQIREAHRTDLLQVLAYSTLFNAPKITACLVYPCRKETWTSLKERGQFFRRASVHSGHRQVNLVLTSVPMCAKQEDVIESLAYILN